MPDFITENALDFVPTPEAIRYRLNETLVLADRLKDLLALSEKLHGSNITPEHPLHSIPQLVLVDAR